ncbi:MAG: 30S ribosomal protein S20 [Opitutia bacterium]|jgi:small subunit ribosomal protein S20
MANIKANKKAARQTATRTVRNRGTRTHLKGVLKDFGATPSASAASKASSALDKAVKTGVIHRNKANRLKAKFAAALAKAKAK